MSQLDRVKSGVVVIAHPDDEVLWAGSLLASNPGRWTVICCSIPRIDPIRAWKFFDACEMLGAKARLLPLQESPPDRDLLCLEEYLDLASFDCIATHGPAGESNHRHHHQVRECVVRKYPQTPKILFGYGVSDAIICTEIELSDAQFDQKLRALKCYDHILPYGGRNIPKWEALLERYCGGGGERLRQERHIIPEAVRHLSRA